MARKMCPFVTRLQIPVKKELKIEYYREDVGIGFPCVEDKCMAWIPERIVKELTWGQEIVDVKKKGRCKLIPEG